MKKNKSSKKYVLRYGFRRLEASRKLGYDKIEAKVGNEETTTRISIEDIEVRDNIRTNLNQETFVPLMESIRDKGLLQPIGLVKAEDFDGESFTIINTSENVHREDINPIELGKIVAGLKSKYNLSNGEIAARLNLNKSRIESALRCYNLVPKELHKHIGYNPGGQGKKHKSLNPAIVSVVSACKVSKSKTKEILQEVSKNNLSLRETRQMKNLIVSNKMQVKDALKILEKTKTIHHPICYNTKVMDSFISKNGLTSVSNALKLVLSGKKKPLKNMFIF